MLDKEELKVKILRHLDIDVRPKNTLYGVDNGLFSQALYELQDSGLITYDTASIKQERFSGTFENIKITSKGKTHLDNQ